MFKKREMGKGGRVLMKTPFRAALSKVLSSTMGEWNYTSPLNSVPVVSVEEICLDLGVERAGQMGSPRSPLRFSECFITCLPAGS